MASSLSISPQPVMPASVEILTKTQEFLRTNVSIFVTLILSFGPTGAALVRFAANGAIEAEQRGRDRAVCGARNGESNFEADMYL